MGGVLVSPAGVRGTASHLQAFTTEPCFGPEAALDDLCAAEADVDDPEMDCG